jgi:LysM repeat protein
VIALAVAACGGGNDSPPTPTLAPALPTQAPLLESPTPAPTEQVNGAQEYTVEPGDTLSGIAGQFGVTTDAIIAANEIADPDLIQPGDTLTIPAPEPADAEPTATPT